MYEVMIEEEFSAAHALAPDFTTTEDAMREPAKWLERLAQKVGGEYSST